MIQYLKLKQYCFSSNFFVILKIRDIFAGQKVNKNVKFIKKKKKQ